MSSQVFLIEHIYYIRHKDFNLLKELIISGLVISKIVFASLSSLFCRAETHSSTPSTYKKEINKVEKITTLNEYPTELIRNLKIKKHQGINKELEKPLATMVLPNVPRLK
jgi:hypothetical protein